MYERLRRIITNIRTKKYVVLSVLSVEEILTTIRRILGPRIDRSRFISEEDFSEYLDDFEERGNVAIRSKGFWGGVGNTNFEIATVSGYRAHRMIIPRISCELAPESGGGTKVECSVRAVQRKFIIIFGFTAVIDCTFIVLGLVSLLNSNSRLGGAIAILFGCATLTGMMLFIRFAVPIAEQMLSILEEELPIVAGGRDRTP